MDVRIGREQNAFRQTRKLLNLLKEVFQFMLGQSVCVASKHNLLLCILQFYDLAQFF